MDPIPTPTQPKTNPVISAVVVLDDGSIVAVEPRGIRRLQIGSDVWIKGLRYEGLTSVRQCGNVLYTWSQTGAWSSRDSGRTFRQILMDSLHKITVDIWAGDSAVIIDVDTARRATKLILVNDTTVVRNLTSDVPHRHIIPYVGTVANANESRVLVSGNGVNQLIEPHSGRVFNIVMTPETYLARRLSRYDRGLAAYVEQQGLYRIDVFGRARLDTFVTYSSKRITNLIASPNGSVLVTNTNRYHVWFNENIRDTVIVNRRSDYWRDPQFITETEVYSGASQNGIEVRQLRDTNNKYLVQDGLPTFDRTPATALLEGYPLGFVNGSLICLASGVDRSIGNGVSMNGGVFQIADSKWVHLDDSELGEHRRLSASGECYDNVALMFGYDRYPASSLVQPDQFAYYGKRSKVVRLSGGSDGISTYNFTTVIDEDHVAMYSNVHDTVAVVDLRNMTTTHILAGVPSAIATLNHNIAVATLRDGLMLYPVDTLASSAPDEHGELRLRASWYECSQRLLHVNVKQPSTSPFEIEVYDIVGKVRLRLTHSAQAAFDGSLTFEEWLSPGVYILKVSTGSRSNTQMLLVEDC
ncbi:MAG: T9SS type A sorting domain-containing protein [Bacteroidetes bacterium]|nr:T9SS type A sorting domain-containing protein [Bacteroidota bacterium]